MQAIQKCVCAKDDFARAVGDYVADAAKAAIAARGKFFLALSGGSLIAQLAEALEPLGAALQTELWEVFTVDERVVPVTDADSNHGALQKTLYSKVRALTHTQHYLFFI